MSPILDGPAPRRATRTSAFSIWVAALAACAAPGDGDHRAAPDLEILALSAPTLEIGMLDGPEEYLFGSVTSAVRWGDGTIAVADGGASRISVYDADGRFVRGWGGAGDGPGEFRNLTRLYPDRGGTLTAAHGFIARLATFDREGSLVAEPTPDEISGDTVFALDSWLYGRFWVDGALGRDERARVRGTLDRLPSPRGAPGYRAIRVDAQGRPWLLEPAGAAGTRWIRLSRDGAPEAAMTVQSDFRPTWIGGHEMLGVWTAESGVHVVRVHRVEETGERAPAPSWLSAAIEPLEPSPAPDEEELMATIRGSIKSMASHQEMHYASNYTYTSDIAELESFEQPEGLRVDFVAAGQRGWGAVFALDGVDRLCGLAYGFEIPPGWMPGAVVCGPGRHVDARGAS